MAQIGEPIEEWDVEPLDVPDLLPTIPLDVPVDVPDVPVDVPDVPDVPELPEVPVDV